MTDDDRRLADRLRRYESRVPVDADPVVVMRPRRVPWTALAGAAAVLLLAVVVATNLVNDRPEVGEASPTASASNESPSTDGERTPIVSASLENEGRLLVVEIIGNQCFHDYVVDVERAGDVLEATVTGVPRPIPSGTACVAMAASVYLDVPLEPPFTGTEIRDGYSDATFLAGPALGRVTAVRLDNDGRRLFVEFAGWMESCTDYRADMRASSEVLEIALHPTVDAISCRTALVARSMSIPVDPPFTGREVLDLATGSIFSVDPNAPGETPAPTASPSPAVGVDGVDWEASVGVAVEGYVHRITAEGGRFYALGSRGTGTQASAMVWSSADGRTWTASDPLPRPSWWTEPVAGFFYADELVAVGGRLVAIGSIGMNDGLNVVVWESDDGAAWTVVDTGPFHQAAYNVNDVTNGPGGIVAITHGYVAGSGSAWRSTDGGRTWTEHRPPGSDVATTAVVGTRAGYVMAGAISESYDGTTESPRIWTSADGTNWREASLDGSGGRGRVAQVTIDGSGRWVALGILNDRIVTWRSTNGERWDATADLGPAVDNPWYGLRLAGAPDGYIGLNVSFPTGTWTSEDGIDWRSAPLPQPAGASEPIEWARGIARIGDDVLVGGMSHSDGLPTEWFALRGFIAR